MGTISSTEETFKDKLPCFLKMFTPCNGGSAVETLHMFEFAVPADQKDSFNKAYQTFADAKKQLKGEGELSGQSVLPSLHPRFVARERKGELSREGSPPRHPDMTLPWNSGTRVMDAGYAFGVCSK